jgi:UDP-glucose 4-epimerase
MAKRTALVTGGAGFIGSHVVDMLLAEGRGVVVVDDLSTGIDARIDPRASLERIDIADRPAFDRVADAVRPQAVYHLAAQASVTRSVEDPRRDCVVNVLGTLNVLEAAGRHRASVVFGSTGGALYGNDAAIPTSEDAAAAPISPYGASKWAAEAYVLTWAKRHDLTHAVMRLANVYGPRQSPHGEAGVVAIFSHHLWSGEAPTLLGFGRPTRDYVHVDDIVRALRAAEGAGGVYNVSTGRETDVSTVLDLLQRAAGTAVEPVLAPLREGELERSCLDPRRARRELGWEARVDLEEGLRGTYEALVAEFERSGPVAR